MKEKDIGLYFNIDSINDGKKENSIRNPFPKIMKIKNENDVKIIVVIASIVIENNIYMLPIMKRYKIKKRILKK